MGDDEILIDHSPGETRAAVLYQGRVAELFIERTARPSRLDAIVLARVTASHASGVRVDLGGEDGYLEAFSMPRPAEGSNLMIQVVADARGRKLARASARPTLEGQFMALGPGCGQQAISRQIRAKGARKGLRGLLAEVIPGDCDVAVRAAAGGCDHATLRQDAGTLVALWRAIEARRRTSSPPAVLSPAPDIGERASREYPELARRSGRNGLLFVEHDIGPAIEAALERRVPLDRGGALVIDENEALTAIDVDIPDRTAIHDDPAGFADRIAGEIVWQVRLRRLAGPIVIDFPRFRKPAARDRLTSRLERGFATLRDPPVIHGWTRGGLLEVTRTRRGPTLFEIMQGPPQSSRPSAETLALRTLRRVMRESAGIARPVLICPEPVRQILLGRMRASLDEVSQRLGSAIRVEAGDGIEIRGRSDQ